jgi:hypothetical protein
LSKDKFILGRRLDIWVTGLASIFFIALILIINPQLGHITFGDVLIFTTIINGAHFMASYRMLYYTKEHAMRYPNASFYMPIILVAYCIIAIAFGDKEPLLVSSLLVLASLYLALHYTGQTWGMMSSLAYLEGVRFNDFEKKYFRLSLKFLMWWQVLWSLRILDPKPAWLINSLNYIDYLPYLLMGAALAAGSMAVFSVYKNLKTLKLRMIVPYIALYFWYALLSVNYLALPLIQFFHALQYLIFPVRVELNRGKAYEKSQTRHITEYLSTMLLLGGAAFVLIPYYFKNYNPEFAGSVQVFISAINIHHFYIDGYIWKISQPVVRDELFAHLKG